MKLLAIFMTFLVLALSCLPCADGEMSAAATNKISKEINHNQQDCDDHEDACSPFCHCICCSGFSVNYMIVIAINPASQSSLNHSSFYNSSIEDISIPVWQPPQLS